MPNAPLHLRRGHRRGAQPKNPTPRRQVQALVRCRTCQRPPRGSHDASPCHPRPPEPPRRQCAQAWSAARPPLRLPRARLTDRPGHGVTTARAVTGGDTGATQAPYALPPRHRRPREHGGPTRPRIVRPPTPAAPGTPEALCGGRRLGRAQHWGALQGPYGETAAHVRWVARHQASRGRILDEKI